MLDPLTSIGLASSIVQFVDFTSKLVSKAREIHQSGSTVEHDELEHVTRDLGDVSDRIQHFDTQPLSTLKQSLKALAKQCNELATKFLSTLSNLKAEDRQTHWKSFRQALKAAWGKAELEDVATRLRSYRGQLSLHILVSLRARADIQAALETFSSQQERSDDLNYRYFQKTMAKLGTLQSSDPAYLSRSVVQHTEVPLQNESAITHAVLERLAYRQMSDREDNVATAHSETFHWVLSPDVAPDAPWSNFVLWLENGSGCYWINGKAGSGKSTLMKYISHHPKTHHALQNWARDDELILAPFFFWNSGSLLQRSQTGLLRSLLYTVLGRCRGLIPDVLPALYREEAQKAPGSLPSEGLSDVEAKRAFLKLVELIPTKFRVCFLIDGVDEYSGDHYEISDLFKAVASLDRIKIVLSSRPITACLEAFQDCPGFKLQDLTRNDIERYIKAEIGKHKRMKQLESETPKEAEELIREMTAKASGVFLWVMLVVKSLLRGLSAYDRISDLQRRLEEFPPELEALYKHMLNRMEPLYREQASKLLQIMLKWVETNGRPLTLLQMSFADEEDLEIAIRMPINGYGTQEEEIRGEVMAGRLLSRCCGLLETQGTPEKPIVNFLHKTVVEFLRKADICELMLNLTAGTGFDPNVSLLSSCLSEFKTRQRTWE
ncbi:hypothetical protein AOQ84DRAFT_272155, partial [Glonium stellatum]